LFRNNIKEALAWSSGRARLLHLFFSRHCENFDPKDFPEERQNKARKAGLFLPEPSYGKFFKIYVDKQNLLHIVEFYWKFTTYSVFHCTFVV
jgi:hypothetical protein